MTSKPDQAAPQGGDGRTGNAADEAHVGAAHIVQVMDADGKYPSEKQPMTITTTNAAPLPLGVTGEPGIFMLAPAGAALLSEAEQLARSFHESYERLAPKHGYRTRKGTRRFLADTRNGKLMIAVCGELLNEMRNTAKLQAGAAPLPQMLEDLIRRLRKRSAAYTLPRDTIFGEAADMIDALRAACEQMREGKATAIRQGLEAFRIANQRADSWSKKADALQRDLDAALDAVRDAQNGLYGESAYPTWMEKHAPTIALARKEGGNG